MLRIITWMNFILCRQKTKPAGYNQFKFCNSQEYKKLYLVALERQILKIEWSNNNNYLKLGIRWYKIKTLKMKYKNGGRTHKN